MVKNLLLVILILGFFSISGQTLITPFSNVTNNNGVELSASVGEIATETFGASNNQLTQGFFQSFGNKVSVAESNELKDLSLFPNPFVDEVSFTGNGAASLNSLSVYDGSGKMVHYQSLEGMQKTASLAKLPPGLYFFSVASAKGTQAVFQLIKL